MGLGSGMVVPRYRYDPSQDYKVQQWDKLKEALGMFLSEGRAERREERQKDYAIFQGELSSIRNKGLVVDAEQYFDDPTYRKKIKNEEATYVDVIRKSGKFSSESRGSISPIIQSIGASLNLYGDKTPDYIMDNDLLGVRKILLEGDEDLNQLSVSSLSEQEIAGIDGLEHELRRMGLWQDGENWETQDDKLGVREQLSKRLDWFELGYKKENTNYVATQADANAIALKEMQTVKGRLELVREFQVVKDMENVDDSWLTLNARLFPQDKKNEGTKIYDAEEGDYIEQSDYWAKYPYTSMVYAATIPELSDMKLKNPDTFNDMMMNIQQERPDVFSGISSLVYTYDKGRKMISAVEKNIDPTTYIDLQRASLVKLEDLETAQGDLAPIAQEASYLKLLRAGAIEPPSGFTMTGIDSRIAELDAAYGQYLQFRGEQFQTRQFSLRMDELTNLYDNFISDHMNQLTVEPGEVHPDSRKEYVQTIQDLDYSNVINSLDLLMGD